MGVGLCVYFFLSVLGFQVAWICVFLMCATTVSELICTSVMFVQKRLFSRSRVPSLALTIVPPLLQHRSLNLEKRDLMQTLCWGMDTVKSLTVCTLAIVGLCDKLSSMERRSFSNETWMKHWSLDNSLSLWVVLLLCSLSRIRVVGFFFPDL